MSFVHPEVLLWLIPPTAVIVVLYLLRMRRKDMRVPATFLWPAMTYEVRANSFFQKLRFNWLMVLQLLALSAIVVAVARPQLRERSLSGSATVIIVDASASMNATDVKPSRFGEAVRMASAIVDSARPGDRVAIIEAGPVPRVASALSNDPGKVRIALHSIQPSDADADVGEALRLASSIVAKQATARIILLSDGVFPEVANFSPGKAEVVFRSLGTQDTNAGISAIGTSETTSGPQLFCSVRNYGSLHTNGTLNIYADGDLVDSTKIDLAPRGTASRSIRVPAAAKVFNAKINVAGDLLTADDEAVTIRNAGSSLRVLLVGKGDLFLEHALSLDPRVTLFRASTLPSDSHFDVVVFDGVPEKPTSATGVLTFGASGEGSPVSAKSKGSKATFVSSENDPLMKAVDLDNLYIGSAETVRARADSRVIATGSNGPMIVVQDAAPRHVYVSFTPLESDFPLQPAFPIFIANSLDFLASKGTGSGLLAVPAGKPFAMAASDASQPLSVTLPDGNKHKVASDAGMYVVRDLRRTGKYTLEGDKKTVVYAKFPNEQESQIAPVKHVLLAGKPVTSTSSVLRLADWWRPALLLALLVLAGEWWLFARRS